VLVLVQVLVLVLALALVLEPVLEPVLAPVLALVPLQTLHLPTPRMQHLAPKALAMKVFL